VVNREPGHDLPLATASHTLHYFDELEQQTFPAQWRGHAHGYPSPHHVASEPFGQLLDAQGWLFDTLPSEYRLGEPTQPIAAYRELILDTVANNQATIITAETGSGKSTQLPLYWLEEQLKTGSDKHLWVTSPRILPTEKLQERVRSLIGEDLAPTIGRLTGTAKNSDCPPEAKVIFVTENLLFKLLRRGRISPEDDIMFDEAHELTKHMTFLMALVRETMPETPDRKIFVSSATINSELFSRYFGNLATGQPAPVLQIPGRNFPVEFIHGNRPVHDAARDYIAQGLNVQVFEPGIARMNETASRMHLPPKEGIPSEVHLLYADLSPTEQAEALDPRAGHHIVSNRVGQTSLTPDGKDVVVSSGLSNLGFYQQGEHILATVHASKATITQEGGRVGRTKPGIHELAVPDNAPPKLYEERPEFDPPEIQTSEVMSYITEFLATGRRIEDLSLIFGPDRENLLHDYQVLRKLGALTMVNGRDVVTPLGEEMMDLPLDMPLARMVVEARRFEDADDVEANAVRLQSLAIAAVLQVDGILDAWQQGKPRNQKGLRLKSGLSDETHSDVLFELDAFITMLNVQRNVMQPGEPFDEAAEKVFNRILRRKDVKVNRYYKAVRTFEELCRRERLDMADLRKPSAKEREALTVTQIVGAEEAFVRRRGSWYEDARGGRQRKLGLRSTISPNNAQLLIGRAFTIRGMNAQGRFERRYISRATAVKVEDIIRHAGHRVLTKTIGYAIDSESNILERQAVYFDGNLLIGEQHTEPSPTVETREFILRAMMTGARAYRVEFGARPSPYRVTTPNAKRLLSAWHQARSIQDKTTANLAVDQRYESLIQKVIRQSLDTVPLDVIDPAELDALIPIRHPVKLVRPSKQKQVAAIRQAAPEQITIPIDEAVEASVSVRYRQGIALVSVPTHLKYVVRPEHFETLRAEHPVKIRIASGQYQQFEAAFKTLEELRAAHQKRVERRNAERTEPQDISSLSRREKKRLRSLTAYRDVDHEAHVKHPARKPWLTKHNAARALSKEVRRVNRTLRRKVRQTDWSVVPEFAD
jgi:HrpA-like RNA helicase